MKVSELTLDIVKNYLRVDDNSDDILLNACIGASKSYVKSCTHLTDEELDNYDDIVIAMLALIADMYELRQATTSVDKMNPCIDFILHSHSRGLI